MSPQKHHKPTPPQWLDKLLEHFCAPHLLEEVLGDLHERYQLRAKRLGEAKARRQYLREVLAYVRPSIFKRKTTDNSNLTYADMIQNYFTSAYRSLSRHKGFSAINISGLTLGLISCLLIGLFVWDELQYDQFIPEGDRVYRIYNELSRHGEMENFVRTPPMFAPTLLQQLPEVEKAVRVMEIQSVNLFEAGDKQIYEKGGIYTEQGFFEIFPLPFIHGSSKNALAEPASVVLSEELAAKYFGDENPVGKEILIQKEAYQIKGVFQNKDVKFHLNIQYVLPLAGAPLPEEDMMQSWRWQQFNTYVKLKEGTDKTWVESKFQDIIREKAHPVIAEVNISYLPFFQPLKDIHLYSANFKYDMAIRGNITYVRALSITAVFILMIACFNFINLSTASAMRRAKEVGVRKAIGASRSQLIFQFIGESMLFSLISILISLALVLLLLPSLNQFTDKQISIDVLTYPIAISFIIGLTLLVGLFAGFYPALVLSGFQPSKVLKGMVWNTVSSARKFSLRHALVVVQFTLSALLIISSIVIYKQVVYLNEKDLGFNKEEIMFFPMRGENMFNNYQTFKNELLRIPGVSSISMGYGFPGDLVAGDDIIVPREGAQKRYPVTQLLIDHDYIKTLGVQLMAGRDFSEEISSDKHQAFIINEKAVKELGFETAEIAIGENLLWEIWGADSLKKGQIIGVVKDFHYKSLYDKVEPTVLQIFPDAYWQVAVKFKTTDLENSIAHVKEVWNSFSPEFPIEYRFLDENFEKMYKAEDKLKSLLWIFTLIAIFLGCLGLFALAAYAVERRTKEIGVRKILGGSVSHIALLLSQDFVKLILISLMIAVPLAWYTMDSWLQNFAYRISINWWMFLVAGNLILLIALLAVGFHVMKAAFKNPVDSLRNE